MMNITEVFLNADQIKSIRTLIINNKSLLKLDTMINVSVQNNMLRFIYDDSYRNKIVYEYALAHKTDPCYASVPVSSLNNYIHDEYKFILPGNENINKLECISFNESNANVFRVKPNDIKLLLSVKKEDNTRDEFHHICIRKILNHYCVLKTDNYLLVKINTDSIIKQDSFNDLLIHQHALSYFKNFKCDTTINHDALTNKVMIVAESGVYTCKVFPALGHFTYVNTKGFIDEKYNQYNYNCVVNSADLKTNITELNLKKDSGLAFIFNKDKLLTFRLFNKDRQMMSDALSSVGLIKDISIKDEGKGTSSFMVNSTLLMKIMDYYKNTNVTINYESSLSPVYFQDDRINNKNKEFFVDYDQSFIVIMIMVLPEGV